MAHSFGLCIVGYGLAGKVFHAPLITATPGLHLAGVVSSDSNKVLADYPDVTVFSSVEAALNDSTVNAIVLACPDELHATLACAALEAGRHVVIDKPFAPTLAEAQKVVTVAGEQDRLVTVFHNRRWDADFLTLQAMVDAGELGEIVQFESHFDRYKPEVGQRWKDRRGGGVWFDLGAHLVDQALLLFGMPQSVYADIGTQKTGGEGIDYAHVLLRYPRTRVILHMSQSTSDCRLRFAVHGTAASWVKHGLDRQEEQSKAGMAPGAESWGEDPEEGRVVTVAGDERLQPNCRGNYLAFYEGLRAAYAREAANPVTPEEALAVMAVLETGLESARRRCELVLGPTV